MEEVVQTILNLVKKKMREQGAYDRDAYKNLIQETIDYYKEKGMITDDDNEEFIKDRLMEMWGEVQDYLAQKY